MEKTKIQLTNEQYNNLVAEPRVPYYIYRNNSAENPYILSQTRIERNDGEKYSDVSKYLYDDSNLSDEEKERLSFFPEYNASYLTIITNTGLICFVTNAVENNYIIIYDILKKDASVNLNNIAFGTDTMVLGDLPGQYNEYSTPLSYFKVQYDYSNNNTLEYDVEKNNQIVYQRGNKYYVRFPADYIENKPANDNGLFETQAKKFTTLTYKYNQIYMFKTNEEIAITCTNIPETDANRTKTASTSNNHIVYFDLSNYFSEKVTFSCRRINANSQLESYEKIMEVLC